MVTETGLKAHDVAALIPVIEGAGGVVTDWRGDTAAARRADRGRRQPQRFSTKP